MKIFTVKERNEIINQTLKEGRIKFDDIVSRVSAGIAAEIDRRWGSSTSIVVFAGWGTNGAYALGASQELIKMGYNPCIFLFNIGGNRLTDECARARQRLLKACPKADLTEIVQSFEPFDIDPKSVVLDGLFGADLDRPLPKSFGILIRSINESGARIVSIDIPSGLFGEWNTGNSIHRDIVHAALTLAIDVPCMSYFIKENIPLVGEWKIIDAGLSREAMRRMPYQYHLVTRHDIHCMLRPRAATSSKADYGSALICAGSYGMMGAAVLAARGCLRAGVGKVTCHAPRCGYQVLQTAVPPAMFVNDTHETVISSITMRHDFTGVAVGPGIGTSDITVNALENLLKQLNAKNRPVVVDADALNCIAKRPNMMNYLPQLSILTPHEGEFDRIFGEMPSSEARIQKALEVAAYHNIVIVLKGRYTAIVRPDGKVHYNTSGTPALATAGSGDVLTGVITAFLAQGYTPEVAAIIGVYVHGLAGELASDIHGTYGVTSDDVADNVGRAIMSIMK